MALNWQHIKGVNSNADNTLLYTYIQFASNDDTPEIYTGSKNTFDSENLKYWGNILTTDGNEQIINKTITIKSDIPFNFGNSKCFIKYITGDEMLKIAGTKSFSDESIFDTAIFNQAATFNDDITLNGGKTLVCGSSTKITSKYIQAPYFNATSDKRAKTNIQPFNGNALDIINKLQTYTYNYTNSQIKSYGVMAQDLLDVNLNGFSFVENKAATGENNDYMSIHESKLVYLLIEAVKEQQIQINELKKQVEELINGK